MGTLEWSVKLCIVRRLKALEEVYEVHQNVINIILNFMLVFSI